MNTTTKETACKGTVTMHVNQKAQTIQCKFAELTQGAICSGCPWSQLCASLFTNKEEEKPPVKTVLVKAFSGMPIAELPVTHETKTSIEVTTGRGLVLRFDKKTGKQMNAKDPKFANRIDV